MLKVNEIFFSIQGESTSVGQPTVFIRLSGCDLRCTYCDTTYAYYEGEKVELDEIIAKVKTFPARFVCVTGGEPLLQKKSHDLMSRLCDLDYNVSIETGGHISCRTVDPRVRKIIDVKTPDSGEGGSFCMDNLELTDVNLEFKFVICSEKDFYWSNDFVQRHKLSEKYEVLFSPQFESIRPQWLAEKILTEKSKARLQLQLHKYIWSPDSRGV
jgi:7-carboxy-7-deazaguanine synthase